jgi:hypothetical protein
MDNTRSFEFAGTRCVFADGPARRESSGINGSLIDSAHHLSDALQAEHAEISHFQAAAHRLHCQMHELQRACEAYLTTCHAIDTKGLNLEMKRLSFAGSCPYVEQERQGECR